MTTAPPPSRPDEPRRPSGTPSPSDPGPGDRRRDQPSTPADTEHHVERPDTDRRGTGHPDADHPDTGHDRRSVVARQREQFGGMKFGACFFGWLTATGAVVLLSALTGAVAGGVASAQGVDPADASQNPTEIGIGSAIVLLVVVLVGYLAGGYVAGRMARFNGLRQGVGVWLWAVIIAIVVAVLGLVAGQQFDLLAQLEGTLRIPIDPASMTTAGVLAALGVAVVSLIGAVLGGLAGMRYHRRVDIAGLGR